MDNVFSHIAANGKLRMVDITSKRVTRREAHARCVVVTTVDLAQLSAPFDVDVMVATKLAGINAAKRTSDLIPLCHPLNPNRIDVEVLAGVGFVEIRSTVAASYRTGVEMEALTACAVAALSLLDVLRAQDPLAHVEDLAVTSKTGGKSGSWGRDA